jgi:hypothetical protein
MRTICTLTGDPDRASFCLMKIENSTHLLSSCFRLCLRVSKSYFSAAHTIELSTRQGTVQRRFKFHLKVLVSATHTRCDCFIFRELCVLARWWRRRWRRWGSNPTRRWWRSSSKIPVHCSTWRRRSLGRSRRLSVLT